MYTKSVTLSQLKSGTLFKYYETGQLYTVIEQNKLNCMTIVRNNSYYNSTYAVYAFTTVYTKETEESKMSVQIEIVNPEDKRVKISSLKVGDWFISGNCNEFLYIVIKTFGDGSATVLEVKYNKECAFKSNDLVYLTDVKIVATKKV
jgi:hypothetical protein